MKILRWIGALFLPMFTRPRLSPGLIWFLHLLIIAGITVGLYFLQQHYRLTEYFGFAPLRLRPFSMPILFLLLYFIVWQAWWVWRLMQPEAIGSDFPDLDDAWKKILESLGKAGIGIGDTPVFMVFGRVDGPDESIFQAIPGGLQVTGGSPSGSPIRAFASRDAIFVTLPGASLASSAASIPVPSANAANYGQSIGGGQARSVGMDMSASIGMDKSIGMGSMGPGGGGGGLARIQHLIRQAREEGRPLTDAENAEIRRLGEGGGGGGAAKSVGTKSALVQDPAEVEYREARLTHACGLVARSRWPLCAINGGIVYVSVTDCEREENAQQLGLIIRQDIRVAEDTFRLTFPVHSLVGRWEELPGGKEFLTKFAVDRKSQRFGKGFPLSPDLPPEASAEQAERSALWIFHSLLPYWIFKMFAVERGSENAANATRANSELFAFLNSARTHGSGAARLIGRVATPGSSAPIRFGGCYLTANVPELGSGPLFLDEFYKKVVQSQGFVEWTDAAFEDDARYRRNTKLGYMALAGVVLGIVALGAYVGISIGGKK